MLEFEYCEYYRNSKDIYNTRWKTVRYAKEHGNKPAAGKFATTMKTIRKCVGRFEQGGKSALQDRSRRPLNSPGAIKPYWKFKILGICKELKDTEKSATGALLRRKRNIPYSLPTVLKTMREGGYVKLRKRRAQRNRDLREKKREPKASQKIQMDVKYLKDIPKIELERRVFELPRYQFSVRCVCTGAYFTLLRP
jgi:transposase